jgi:DNA-binding transcriptional ArsR family regulator
MGTIGLEMGTINSDDRISSVLFGKTRRAVLSILYRHADESFYLMQLVRAVGAGKGAVQRELKLLNEAGIITREKIGRQIFYQANRQCPIYEELRQMIVKTIGYADVLRTGLETIRSRIKIAFIYGSVAKADETRTSDVDIMVIGDASFSEVVSAIQLSQTELKREVNPTVYPVREFKNKIRTEHHFIKQVLSEPRIFLIGDEDELSGLAGK